MIVFLFAMVLTELSRTMTLVQIPIYLRELGASIQEIGFFFTISLVFPLLLRIVGGWLSDTAGRLPSLTLGSLAGVISFVVYLISPSWQLALLAPAFLAITAALIFPSYKAYIADQTPDEMQGRVFGLTETIISIAWIIGPPIGGVIANTLGYSWMFAVATIAFSVATLLFFFMHRTDSTHKVRSIEKPSFNNFRSTLRQMLVLMISGGLVTWIIIVDGVRDIAFKMSFDLMPIYLSEIAGFAKSEIGLLDGIFGIALAVTTLPAGWLVDKTSERVGITLGLAVMILSRLVISGSSLPGHFSALWVDYFYRLEAL
jgi:MFS family permease